MCPYCHRGVVKRVIESELLVYCPHCGKPFATPRKGTPEYNAVELAAAEMKQEKGIMEKNLFGLTSKTTWTVGGAAVVAQIFVEQVLPYLPAALQPQEGQTVMQWLIVLVTAAITAGASRFVAWMRKRKANAASATKTAGVVLCLIAAGTLATGGTACHFRMDAGKLVAVDPPTTTEMAAMASLASALWVIGQQIMEARDKRDTAQSAEDAAKWQSRIELLDRLQTEGKELRANAADGKASAADINALVQQVVTLKSAS